MFLNAQKSAEDGSAAVEDRTALSAEILKKIKRIELRAGHLVNEAFAGSYLSSIRGQGMEFEAVREYVPGDDVRRIDWKVTARLGKTQIKQFREERELVIYLLIDVSSSGRFGSVDVERAERIAELAAALAFCTTKNNDRIGVLFFADGPVHHIPPGGGKGHIFRLIREILTHRAVDGERSALLPAVERLIHLRKRQTVVFLLSDLWFDDRDVALERLSARHPTNVFWLRDQLECELPPGGLLPVADLETGETVWIDLSRPETRAKFRELADQRSAETKRLCSRLGARLLCLQNDQGYIDDVLSFFRKSGLGAGRAQGRSR
jgi:uncharacterized protein (DUF58 family)